MNKQVKIKKLCSLSLSAKVDAIEIHLPLRLGS